MRKFIIKELQTLNVINETKLIEYVDFCLDNISDEGANHHILPKAIFPKCKSLKKNSWNCAKLSYANHYLAHFLLTQAIENYSFALAFIGMHNKDIKINRIHDNILINANKYQLVKEQHSKLMSKLQNTVEANGKTRAQNNAKKTVETKRLNGYYDTLGAEQLHTKEVRDKINKTIKQIDPETGLTPPQKNGLKRSEWFKKNPDIMSGENNHFYGKTHSEESKQKMRKPKSNTENMKWSDDKREKIISKLKNRKISEKTKMKMSKSWQKHKKIGTCPHCGRVGNERNLKPYHFDNCKYKT